MLHLGIDLHAKQITVNLRDEKGDAVLRRQVSTAGDKPALFLAEVALLAGEGGYVAILEVCGFHDWLTQLPLADGLGLPTIETNELSLSRSFLHNC